MASVGECLSLVARLERTINYPKDADGVEFLAKGLQRAAEIMRVDAAKVVERCAELSQYCPTDADMLNVAREIRGPETWQPKGPARCQKCFGSGWEISWWLHTQEGNGRHNFIRKQKLTEAQANDLQGKIDRQKQAIYSAARRCTCPVPEDRQSAAAGDNE